MKPRIWPAFFVLPCVVFPRVDLWSVVALFDWFGHQEGTKAARVDPSIRPGCYYACVFTGPR